MKMKKENHANVRQQNTRHKQEPREQTPSWVLWMTDHECDPEGMVGLSRQSRKNNALI